MDKIIIIIPIYKEIPNSLELLSINRCSEILLNYEIIFIHPTKMKLDFYKEKYENKKFLCFDKYYFESIQGYNKLMLSINFYKTFIDYEYILIYQTDCYVFRDELKYYTDKDYDYIGGLWFKGFDKELTIDSKLYLPGNGGFSLRKTKAMIDFLSSEVTFYIEPKKKTLIQKILRYFRKKKTSINKLLISYNGNEDVFIVEYGLKSGLLKIPNATETLLFSWDRGPYILYEKHKKLPMACHAWYRNDFPYMGNLEFWNFFIN